MAQTAKPQRIVSLLPSVTETLFALGVGDRVVGISHECDFPAEVHDRTVLTAPRIDTTLPPAEIQSEIAKLAGAGQALYDVDAEEMAGLKPDLIITQDQCPVCAVSLDDVEKAVMAMGREVPVVTVRPTGLADIPADIRTIATAVGAEDKAAFILHDMDRRMASVGKRAKAARGKAAPPRVVCLEWLDPLMLAGHWVPTMVQLAGGEYELVPAGEPSRETAWGEIMAYQPEAIFLFPCGYKLDQTRPELPRLKARPGFASLPAAKSGRVWAVDGNAFFNRPGPRIVDSLEFLALGLWGPSAFPDFADRAGIEKVV
jgi:iron complex transport system substrate-binding protein